MPGAIIIEGNLKWIIPLLIIIASAAFTLYTIAPTIEFFVEKSIDINQKTINIINKKKSDDSKETKDEETKDEEIKEKPEKEKPEKEKPEKEKPEKEKPEKDKNEIKKDSIDKNDMDNLEKMIEELKKKLLTATKKLDSKKTKFAKPVNPSYKENFVSYTDSAEILRPTWIREPLPHILEKYNGQIQGYNCREYSEFEINQSNLDTRNKSCNTKYMKPPTSQSDYIFPGRKVNNTNCIKYASKPHILGYEDDVNKKILEHESMNVLPAYNPYMIASIERPKYTYNHTDGIDDPIITDKNRFEMGKLNAFNIKN